ncbi:MAG: MlaD family protein [Lentisphaeria bacterium]|jgi:phospholipid/cholesterol/gamma-HCH transport system substrate-binding protein
MNSKRRLTWQELSLEFLAGLFFALTLTILIVFTVILSRGRFSRKAVEHLAEFKEVSGLSEGDNVQLFGVTVGRVEKVYLENLHVRVRLRLLQPVPIYRDHQVEIRHSSVLGGRYVAIVPGTPASGAQPTGEPLHGVTPTDLVNETTKMVETLRDEVEKIRRTFDQEQVVPKFARFVDNINAVSEDIRAGKGSLGKLVQDPALYDRANETLASLNAVTTGLRDGKGTLGKLMVDDALYNDLRAISGDLRAGKGTLGKLMVDDALYTNLTAASADLRTISATVAKGESTLGRLLLDDGKLYLSLRATLDSTREVAESVRAGKGTLGKLAMDPALYDDTRQTILEMRGAIQDFREQAPISTFGSILFGAF